jgi:hypothetical protein
MSLFATVLIDPPTTLFAGGILALISMKLVQKNGVDEVWRVGQLSFAWGFIYGLSVGWHFFFRTDWMFFYAMDTSSLPLVPIYAVFVLICAAWGGIGGLSVAALVHAKKTALAWAAFFGSLLGFVMLLLITIDQYKHVGTRAEYLAGTAKLISDDPNWVMASNVSPAIFGLAAVGIIVLQVRRMRAP